MRWVCGATPPGLVGIVVLIGLTLAASTRQYVTVWQSDLALWAHAVALAPQKPRALNNYGVALAAKGRLGEALRVFRRVVEAGASPRLPRWDRREGAVTGRANVRALTELLAQLQQGTRP